jgi:thiamine biosynthesis lipoprotein
MQNTFPWQTILWFALTLLLVMTPAGAAEYLTRDEALALAFPEGVAVEARTVTATKEEVKALETRLGRKGLAPKFAYFAGRKGGKLLGYAVITEARGKSQPFTYMVAADPKGTITTVELLAYRESHGGEIRQRRFLDQFKGKNHESPLKLRSDIHNISGATISCRSITDGIRAVLACLDMLVLPREQAEMPAAMLLVSAGGSDVPLGRRGPLRRAQYLMGTLLEITVYAPNRADADRAVTAAFAEVARLEALLSTFRSDSELSRLNATGTVRVSLETLAVLAHSRQMHVVTRGAFDVTVGPLVRLWKDAAANNRLPTATAIRTAQAWVDARQLVLNAEGGVATLHAGFRVDVGGIGKGYALDAAAVVLHAQGITAALLNFGGQLLAVGPPPAAPGWPVEIRDPRDADKSLATLCLTRGSVSTSADDARGLRIAGRQYSHIMNPRTGQPAAGMLSATVVTETAVEADALSTGLYVLGLAEGLAVARERGLAVLLLDAVGQREATEAFIRLAEKETR